MVADEIFRQQRIAQFAQMAISTMLSAGVPLTPENYAVFYAYAENRLPDLNASMDRLFAEKRVFDAELCAHLYHEFLGAGDELDAVREVNEHLSQTLAATQRNIGDARQITQDFGTALKRHGEPGSSGDQGEEAKLEHEVATVVDQLAAVQARLQKSEEEVADLKSRLAEVEQQARIDALTGLANRRYLDEHLDEMVTACRAQGQSFSVLMADIDFFKAFNDQHGHAIGDQVLRLVARTILDNIRPGDVAVRYGGEEFAILLPDAGLEEGLEVAERINVSLRGRGFIERHSRRRLGNVTLSIGVASLDADEMIDATFRRADRALYMAKSNGRDRVCCQEVEGHEGRIDAALADPCVAARTS